MVNMNLQCVQMYVSIFCQHFWSTLVLRSPVKNPGKTATGNVRIDEVGYSGCSELPLLWDPLWNIFQ